MKSEVLSIVRYALSGDLARVKSYADLLAKNAEKAGETQFACHLRQVVNGTEAPASLDALPFMPPHIQDPKSASTAYEENLLPPVPAPGICAGRDFWQGCFRNHCDCWHEAGCPQQRPAR